MGEKERVGVDNNKFPGGGNHSAVTAILADNGGHKRRRLNADDCSLSPKMFSIEDV
jgi:hypothetical protein